MGSYLYLMISQPIGGRRIVKQQLKSQLLLVNFHFFFPNFILIELVVPWYFIHTFSYVHKFQYCVFRAFSAANFLAHLKNSAHMLIISLYTIFQVTNN